MRAVRIASAWSLLAAMFTLGGPGVTTATAVQPNFVVIMTDDQTLEQMNKIIDGVPVMANTLSLIGDAGATFSNAFASFPLCCPSRATFLTGQYAHNHGVLENDQPTGGYGRLDHANTLPVWLQRAGYRTIHVGKYLNSYGQVNPPAEIPPGYDRWTALVDPSTYRMWGYELNEQGTVNTYGSYEDEDPLLYQTSVLAGKAVSEITLAADAGKPFFMNLWFLAPHREVKTLSAQFPPRPHPGDKGAFASVPLPEPPSYNEADMSDKALFMQAKPPLTDADKAVIETQYRAELESLLAVDRAVRDVVTALETEGLLEDTYVFFLSDNGYFHGEHRTPDEKILGYESSVRVPLLVRGPGIAPGTVVEEMVANVDLAPTITGLAGASPTLEPDGRSLLPYVLNPGLRTTRPILFEAFFPIGSAVGFFTGQLPPPIGPGGGGGGGGGGPPQIPLGKAVMSYQAVRTDRYVLIEYSTGERELYDLGVDPDQLTSFHLDSRYLETQAALLKELELLRLCRGSGCRRDAGAVPDPS